MFALAALAVLFLAAPLVGAVPIVVAALPAVVPVHEVAALAPSLSLCLC